ncbi:MAG: carboxypeptidase regulatory-like domain-containing protein [Spirosomaceae bacterium]|nr:carboxypeptidase regulatory-like domain-containing protein [Spirosomataceae bacterium]
MKKTLLFLIGFLFCLNAFSQGTDATIAGVVKDEKGEPVIGATIRIKNESTGFSTGTSVNLKGEYSLQQLPLGGPYSISFSSVGYQNQTLNNYFLNQADKLIVNATMKEGSTTLQEVVVTANAFQNKETERAGASIAINSAQMRTLPLENRSFTALTALAPTQGRSGSFSGQRVSSTNFTVDGANARNVLTDGPVGRGRYTITMEAIREYQVTTNSYDVSQGRQGGGSINAVTKAGTNKMEGSAFLYSRNDALASKFDVRGNPRTVDFFAYQYGFSLGGAIKKDKLHYFVAFEREDSGEPVNIANVFNAAEEARFGITKANLDRIVQIGRDKYGLNPTRQQYGEFQRNNTANAFFGRLDWQINDKNTLTFRNNYTDWNSPLSVNDNSNINLWESWSDFSSVENSALVSLRSQIKKNLTNEAKIQYQYAYRKYTPSADIPAANIPRAIITVTSPFPTSANPNATQTRTVQIGGQRFTPETDQAENLHISNMSYLSLGKFNFKFGTDNIITFLNTKLVNEMNGRFFFATLNDFDNMRPTRYAREVPLTGDPTVKQTIYDLSAFAQLDFKPSPTMDLMFGLRYDVTMFANQGTPNPTVERTLGIRTDNKMNDFNNIQPRVQFIWDIGGRQKDILKIGGGLFSAQPVSYLQVNNIQNSGSLVGAIDVSGAGVPTPDFVSYRRDPSTAPGIPQGASYISTINAVSNDFQVPTVYKFNVSYNRFFNNRFRMGVNFLYANTQNNYVYFDRNLVDQPFFTLSNENNRGVFVPANTIPANGTTDWTRGRKTNEAGRVLELESTGVLENWSFVIDASMKVGQDGNFTVSYTRNDTRDNSSFNCCVANTSTFRAIESDPRVLDFSYSDGQFSDKIVVSGVTPSWKGIQFGAIYNGVGGTRYSFLTGGNRSLNGDFVLTNDLAFVFDPNNSAVSEDIRRGMQGLLDNPDVTESVKNYIRNNVGRVAARNGGINPFYGTVDLRLTKGFKTYKNQKLDLSVEAFNFMNLLDKTRGISYLHGNVNLVSITGFNQATQNYNYRVESGAGLKSATAGGSVWRIQVGMRYSF